MGRIIDRCPTCGAAPAHQRREPRRLAVIDVPDVRGTCRNFGGEEGTNGEYYDFACSKCGYMCSLTEPKYCPNCGRVVVG